MSVLTKPPAYSMKVFWSEEDQAFIAVCPELNDVSAFGETYEDAVRELGTAIALTVEVMQEDGDPLPAQAAQHAHSGQFRLRLPRSLHGKLAAAAERDGVSLNTFVVNALGENIAANSVVERAGKEIVRATALMIQSWSQAACGLTVNRSARSACPPSGNTTLAVMKVIN